MTEQKMEFETYQSWLWERCLISTHPHFFKYKLRLLGAKVNNGQSETRFVCLFIWCCLQNRICYVCTLISSMELFIVYWKWAIFIDLMNFLNMPPSQETLHGFIVPWAGCETKLSFKTDVVVIMGKYLSTNLGDNIEKAFKGWWHNIYVEPQKTRAEKKYEKRLFKNGCQWNTNGNENLHVPATTL